MSALLDCNEHSFLLFCSLTLLFLAKKPEHQKLMKYCCISAMISFVAIDIVAVQFICVFLNSGALWQLRKIRYHRLGFTDNPFTFLLNALLVL